VAKHGLKAAPEVEETTVVEGTALIETDPSIEAEIASREVVDTAIGAHEGDLISATGVISESVVKEEKPKTHKPKKSRAELEAEVNSARDDLGTTLDELVSKVYDLTPKNQAKRLKKTARNMALQTIADVRGFFAGEGMPADPERRKMVERVLKAAGGVVGLVALRAMLRGLRNHHTEHAIKKAAKQAAKETARHHSGGSHEAGGKRHGRSKHSRKGRDLGDPTTIVEMIDPIFEVDGTYYDD